MCRRTVHFIVLLVIFALFCPSPVRAQLPRPLKRCLPYPTLADEISEMRESTHHPKVISKVIVDDLKFDGAIHLPEETLEQLTAEIKRHEFQADSDWLGELQEVPIRNAWADRGYFRALVTAESQVLSADSGTRHVSLTVHVNEGPQYRLSEVRFQSAEDSRLADELFSYAELRQQIPLRDGDLFNVEKIREGLDARSRLYGSKGYVDFTAEPRTDVGNEHQTVALTIVLSKEQQYRVASVEILGLDPALESLLRSLIRPGEIFNPQILNNFYKEHTSVLPPGAAPEDDEVLRDVRNATVALRLDFRPCPAP
jgi:surface antigen-like variable number repeat protein